MPLFARVRQVHVRVEMDGARPDEIVDEIILTPLTVSKLRRKLEQMHPRWQRIDVAEPEGLPSLCWRTFCMVKPGEPVPGVACVFRYLGRMPNTGSRRCITCGRLHPNEVRNA